MFGFDEGLYWREYSLKDLFSDKEVDLSELGFENGLKLLEELVTKVETGGLALDKSILAYEKGVNLIKRLRQLLSGAEEKLKVLQKGSGKD